MIPATSIMTSLVVSLQEGVFQITCTLRILFSNSETFILQQEEKITG